MRIDDYEYTLNIEQRIVVTVLDPVICVKEPSNLLKFLLFYTIQSLKGNITHRITEQ